MPIVPSGLDREMLARLDQLAGVIPISGGSTRGHAYHDGETRYAVAFPVNTLGVTSDVQHLHALLNDVGLVVDACGPQRDNSGYVDLSAVFRGEPLVTGNNTCMRWSRPGDKSGCYEFVIEFRHSPEEVLRRLDKAIGLAVEERRRDGSLAHMPHLQQPGEGWRRHLVSLPAGLSDQAVLAQYLRQTAPEGLVREVTAEKHRMGGHSHMRVICRVTGSTADYNGYLSRLPELVGNGVNIAPDLTAPEEKTAEITLYGTPRAMLEHIQLRDPQGLQRAIDSASPASMPWSFP